MAAAILDLTSRRRIFSTRKVDRQDSAAAALRTLASRPPELTSPNAATQTSWGTNSFSSSSSSSGGGGSGSGCGGCRRQFISGGDVDTAERRSRAIFTRTAHLPRHVELSAYWLHPTAASARFSFALRTRRDWPRWISSPPSLLDRRSVSVIWNPIWAFGKKLSTVSWPARWAKALSGNLPPICLINSLSRSVGLGGVNWL